MADVTMPRLSDTMEEGKILRWLKREGERVEAGELLVEVETDKADMEVESSASGVLRQLKVAEGATAPVGAVIAVIDAGDAGAAGGNGKVATPAPRPAAAPEAAPARPPAPPAARAKPTAPPPRLARARAGEPAPRPETTPRTAAPRGGEVKASPLARSLAEELGIDLATVRGTGPAGRITRRDVEDAQARSAGGSAALARAGDGPPQTRGRDDAAPAPSADGPSEERPAESGGARRVALSKMRASIAKRMTESKREAPHFYLTTVVDMDDAVRLRAQLKAFEVEPAVTYNHMVLKACADALTRFPEVNARFAGDAIEVLAEINIGIATAVDDGLLVPVLSGADRLDLTAIAARARELAEKAAGGRFTSADLSGATFSVSNLGMFDVDSFSAVLNPPQAAILAVGSVKQRPVVRDGVLAVGYTMALTLSCDHRVVDGALGGRFLADVKRRLENPAALLLAGGGPR
jgi:pyruvate dehydrogenase E2 component (dihydrolipoamide acetyltransferase)